MIRNILTFLKELTINKKKQEILSPCFIIETPRAGQWGHRFITTSNFKSDSLVVANYCMRGFRQTEGDDFISSTRLVKQISPNGAVRDGNEIIMLAGINVSKLTVQEKIRITKELEKHLVDLEYLIKHVIDWDIEGKNLIVKRKELDLWLKEMIEFLKITRY
tara:strand:+ start:2759 stop:3244 length:486 start_codon:yes stop_codon:yes gene_type:complete